MRNSVSANAIRGAYIDDATKRALLGSSPGTSFGLPMSTFTTFKVSALEEGPVILVPALAGMMIVPLQAMCGAAEELAGDISAALGWPAPDPDDPGEHNEPWLAASTLWYGGEEMGSLVLLPNTGALPNPRLWPECLMSRPFAVEKPGAPAARGAKAKKHTAREDTDEALAEERRQTKQDEAEAESRYQAKSGKAAEEKEAPDPDLTIVVFYTVF